jgi:hypothetical protein
MKCLGLLSGEKKRFQMEEVKPNDAFSAISLHFL